MDAKSIQHCGQWLLVLGSLWLPLFGVSLLCAVTLAGNRWHLGAPATPAVPAAPGSFATTHSSVIAMERTAISRATSSMSSNRPATG
jgi:hypothetical protein